MASFSHAYAESENPFVSSMRSVTSTVGRWFDETETAKVTKWVKELDPSFTTEGFLVELREYIVPELVDAYVNADQPTLKAWCSEAVSASRDDPSTVGVLTCSDAPARRPSTC